MPVVVCRGVAKAFGEGESAVQALRGVDLDVRRGELLMLVGPSGCGKTTLISIIAGILTPDAGTCHVLGVDQRCLPSDAAVDFRAKNIGFIFQAYNLIPSLSIQDNVAIPLLINGVPRPEARERASAILRDMGLDDRIHASPETLSGGQQQRVAIARALVHKPGLVVCDEPTSALDHVTGERVIRLMREAVHERGATLLVVTHDARIFPFADRIATMDDGHILDVHDGTGEAI